MYENYENFVAILNLKKIKKKILMSKKTNLQSNDVFFRLLQNRMSSTFNELENVLSLGRIQMLLLNSHLTYYACVSSQPIEA